MGSIKIYYENNIKKIYLKNDNNKITLSYVELIQQIKKLFHIEDDKLLLIKYQDDENDLITIETV